MYLPQSSWLPQWHWLGRCSFLQIPSAKVAALLLLLCCAHNFHCSPSNFFCLLIRNYNSQLHLIRLLSFIVIVSCLRSLFITKSNVFFYLFIFFLISTICALWSVVFTTATIRTDVIRCCSVLLIVDCAMLTECLLLLLTVTVIVVYSRGGCTVWCGLVDGIAAATAHIRRRVKAAPARPRAIGRSRQQPQHANHWRREDAFHPEIFVFQPAEAGHVSSHFHSFLFLSPLIFF